MFALNKAFRNVELGRLNVALKVRDTDEMHYIIKNFNLMISTLVKLTKEDISSIDNMLSQESNEEIKKELEALKTKLESRITDKGVIGTVAN